MARKKGGGNKSKQGSQDGSVTSSAGKAQQQLPDQQNGSAPATANGSNGGRGKAVAPLPAAVLEAREADRAKEASDLSRQLDQAAEEVGAARSDRRQLLMDKARLEDKVKRLEAQLAGEREAARVWEEGYRRAAWWASANGLVLAAAGVAAAVTYVRYSSRTA